MRAGWGEGGAGWRRSRSGTLVAAVLALALVVTACSGDDDNGSDDAAGPATAQSVLVAGAVRWGETRSAHFELTAEGDTFLDERRSLRLVSAEGVVARPQSARATARVGAMGTTVDVKLVAIGDASYLTNFLSGAWQRAPDDFGYNPALLFDPDRGLEAILPSLGEAQLAGEERVDDREAHRVEGWVRGERIREVTAGTVGGERIEVAAWLARDDSDLLRVTLTAAEAGSGGRGRWDLTIDRHDEDVEITAPM